MSRAERQGTILRLIREQDIATQNELAEALRAAGHDVVQTTVSRDVADLGLVKIRGENGLAYAHPGTPAQPRGQMRDLRLALRRWALSIESSANLVVITTPNGFADPLAQSIDDADRPRILGTIAGENTILVIAAEHVPGSVLRDELRSHVAGEANRGLPKLTERS